MTLADYSLTLFALTNGGRVIAYMPQILRICRDPHGAAAVSLTTWIFFTAANIATVAYALIVANDFVVAIVFAANALGCLIIAGLTAFRRLSCRLAASPSTWPQAKAIPDQAIARTAYMGRSAVP